MKYSFSVVFFYLVYLFQSVVAHSSVQSNIRSYEFNISQRSINPDCSDHVSPVFLINGQMPGPTITAIQGDKVRILIRNQLEPMLQPNDHRHDVSIHFHGIRQYGSVQSDGVPFLTQMPISPGEEYVHEFRVVNQAGTYFYHAHVGFQQETVFGPLIIYESPEAEPENLKHENKVLKAGPYEYDHEHTLLLSEWWHRPHMEFEKFLMGPKFDFIPEADSILINGHTLHNSKQAVVAQCGGYEVMAIQSKKTYRLRVIGATAFRTLGFAIAHHNLTIIEVDGELTKPYTVNQLEVAPGQRFSVLLHTDQAPDDYSIQVVRRWSDNVPRATNGLAILQYPQQFNREYDSRGVVRLKKPVVLEPPVIRAKFDRPEAEVPYWLWSQIQPLYGVDPIVHKPATRTIKLRNVDKRMPDGTTRWFVNNVAFTENHGKDSPILHEIKSSRRQVPGFYNTTTENGYDRNLGTYPIGYFDIVDIVFQTTHKPGEPCRSHPWHTHGHSHWEIAHGKGEYIHERDGEIRNIKNPLQKDITMVYPAIDPDNEDEEGQEAAGCGWSKVRILADNPGVWAVHCHNTAHMLMGMMVALEEAPEMIPRYSHNEA